MAELGHDRQGAASNSFVRRPRGRPSAVAVAQIDTLILDVALEQFLLHGFGQTSMAMIIRAAGVSKTTLYSRYPAKSDLFRAIVQRTVRETLNVTLQPSNAAHLGLVEGLNVFGRRAISISWGGNWPSYERLVYAERTRFPELGGAIAERIRIGIVTVGRFIAECGERDGDPVGDPENVARTYIMGLRGFYSGSLLSAERPADSEIAEFVSGLVRSLVIGRAQW